MDFLLAVRGSAAHVSTRIRNDRGEAAKDVGKSADRSHQAYKRYVLGNTCIGYPGDKPEFGFVRKQHLSLLRKGSEIVKIKMDERPPLSWARLQFNNGAAIGVVCVLATFEPDRSMRYLGLEGFQYVLNVANLILASVGVFLAVRAPRNLKALETE